MVNYPLLSFLSHINYIIPLPEVQSMSGPFDGFLTCVQRNKELVMMMSSRIMTSLLWHQLVIPSWIPFPCVCMCQSVCLCVCVCSGYNFWTSWYRDFIFGVVIHLDNIWVSFEYQGHWVKVMVISWKMLIWWPGHQFNLVWLVWGQGHKLDQGHTKVIGSMSRSFMENANLAPGHQFNLV